MTNIKQTIVNVLREHDEVRNIGLIADELVEALLTNETGHGYYSYDPTKLKILLATRDRWIVENGLWSAFVDSLPLRPKDESAKTTFHHPV